MSVRANFPMLPGQNTLRSPWPLLASIVICAASSRASPLSCPRSESGFEEVVKRIERHPAAKELLRRFLFLHVVPGRLPIVPGHAIFLTYSDAADDFPKAFVVDPHTVALGAGLLGKTISPLQWVWEKVFS